MANTPTAFEQAMLEYINQARMNPSGEVDVVISDAASGTGVQSNITSALEYFGVDIAAFRSQMAAYAAVAPLAWSETLATAADGHSQEMIDADDQSHQLPGEASLSQRIFNAGYSNWGAVAENVYAYTDDPLYGHAGFMVDWGYDDADFNGTTLNTNWQSIGDGMQDAAGHRVTIMSAAYVDIGISAIAESDSATSVGPWVVTQDFAAQQGTNPARLLGVFIDDADGDNFYDIGEGVGAVTVNAVSSAGSTYTTSTWESGGYQMELPAGTYTVRFAAAEYDGSASYTVTIGTENVKQDSSTAELVPDEVIVDGNIFRGTEGDDVIKGSGAATAEMLMGFAGNDVLLGDGLQAVYYSDTSAQVYRLYQAALGREPDNTGHLAWTGRIALEGRALESIAEGFVGSPEFTVRFGDLGDAGFVTLLYNNVLDRDPDTAGLARWTGDLENGLSRAEVLLGFSNSTEFITSTTAEATAFTLGNSPMVWGDDVYRLYQATLDRAPDLTGFVNWSARLGSGTSFETVASGFVNSPEFVATYQNLSNSGFVGLLYNNVLDRVADAAGLANWTARLDGGMTRAKVVEGFSQSAEFVTSTADAVTAWVRAQGVDDTIVGGAGNNVLAGGGLSDTFVFQPLTGNSTILDLEVWDTLDLTAIGYTTDADARSHFSQNGVHVVFDNGADTMVTLLNTDMSMLSDEMILV